jgi:hypothetical protein
MSHSMLSLDEECQQFSGVVLLLMSLSVKSGLFTKRHLTINWRHQPFVFIWNNCLDVKWFQFASAVLFVLVLQDCLNPPGSFSLLLGSVGCELWPSSLRYCLWDIHGDRIFLMLHLKNQHQHCWSCQNLTMICDISVFYVTNLLLLFVYHVLCISCIFFQINWI